MMRLTPVEQMIRTWSHKNNQNMKVRTMNHMNHMRNRMSNHMGNLVRKVRNMKVRTMNHQMMDRVNHRMLVGRLESQSIQLPRRKTHPRMRLMMILWTSLWLGKWVGSPW